MIPYKISVYKNQYNSNRFYNITYRRINQLFFCENNTNIAKHHTHICIFFQIIFLHYIQYCKINPDTTPTKYIIPTILKFSFKCFLLLLNKTKSPTPAPVSKPEIKDAILITFSI